MTAPSSEPAEPSESAASASATSELLITYRYLRLGMVGAAAMLAVSLVYEWVQAGCLQSSISAYYYTPVRSVLVGGLMAIGLCLIAIKGHGQWEDIWLNLAGMFAPVVALVPTAGSGDCQWIETTPPATDGSLPAWVVANIKNNVLALLVVGAVALVLIHLVDKRQTSPDPGKTRRLKWSLLLAEAVLIGAWLLYLNWGEVKTGSHFVAAVLMFVCFFFVVWINAWRRPELEPFYQQWYRSIFFLMPAVAVGIGIYALLHELDVVGEWDEAVYWLEAAEIALFTTFWLVQTKQRWTDEEAGGTVAA